MGDPFMASPGVCFALGKVPGEEYYQYLKWAGGTWMVDHVSACSLTPLLMGPYPLRPRCPCRWLNLDETWEVSLRPPVGPGLNPLLIWFHEVSRAVELPGFVFVVGSLLWKHPVEVGQSLARPCWTTSWRRRQACLHAQGACARAAPRPQQLALRHAQCWRRALPASDAEWHRRIRL